MAQETGSEAPAAEQPTGEAPAAEQPAGEAPLAQLPAADAPVAEQPAGEAPSAEQACVPACRSGYTCVDGQCVSSCNPPCGAGEQCVDGGECVSIVAPAWGATTGGDRKGPGFSFLFRTGSNLGWYYGGHIELGLAFRLSPGLYLVPSAYGGIGRSWSDGDDGAILFLAGGGDVSLRFARWAPAGFVGQLGAGVMYLGEDEYHDDGVDYSYVAPHVRLGGGLQLASTDRFAWGVEGTGRFGYAINVYNFALDEGASWAEDYSGFYGQFDLSVVVAF